MRLAVIMDPIESVQVDRDTSFDLMLAAQARGHEVLYLSHRDLWAEGDQLRAIVRPVRLQRVTPPEHAVLGPPEEVSAAEIDTILVRTDPPFDQEYLQTTQLLELVRGKTLVFNDPRGLREANEKLYALHFANLMPRTIVAQRTTQIRSFVETVGGKAIIKPLNGAGGRGVMLLSQNDLNFHAIVEATTGDGRHWAMVQEYVPAAREGDKRILLLDGEPLGAILRVPPEDDARSNLHVGGTAKPTQLTATEDLIVRRVAPRLRSDGLFFVGLDVIGEKLTEINVTSPTGIQEMSRFTGSNLADRVIAWIENRARNIKQGRT